MARYIMEEMNIPNTDGKKRVFPRLIGLQPLSHDYLVGHVASHSGLERGIVEAVLMRVAECMGELMGSQGASVRIDGIGTFSPKLAMKNDSGQEEDEADKARRNARSICVGGVSFRADRQLISRIDDNCDLHRSSATGTIRPNACPFTPEQRRARLLQYLAETPFISGKKYAELNATPRTAANKELRLLAEGDSPLLACQGRGSHRIYTLRQTADGPAAASL